MQIDVDSQKLREESENTRKKSAQIIVSSQKLREELKAIRKESSQIIARSQSPKNKSIDISTQTIFIDEALQYRNEILGLKSMQPFTVTNCNLSFDDFSDDGIDIDDLNSNTDEETINDSEETIDNTIEETIDNTIEEKIDNTIEKRIKNSEETINDSEEIINDSEETINDSEETISDSEETISDGEETINDSEETINDSEETIDNTIEETIGNTIEETIGNTTEETIGNTTEETIDNTIEETIDDSEETTYINMLNKMIDKVNEFAIVKHMCVLRISKINEIMIEIKEGNICDDEIYEDPWLKLNELHNINTFIDVSFENIWKLSSDNYLVDKHADITNGKINLLNNIGLILDKAFIEIQNKAYIVNDLKQEKNVDIKILKLMHKTLDEALVKWMKTLRKTFKDDMFSRYDMKPDKPLSKKDRKGKKGKGRGKKLNIDKDIKLDTDKDIKPDIDKDKDVKLDNDKDKDVKLDNDNDKDKNILIDIKNNIMILNKMNTNLSEWLKYAYPDKNRDFFDKLCSINKLYINDFFKNLVSDMYAVNKSIESLQRGMLNKLHIKYIDYDQIKKKHSDSTKTRLENTICDTELKINIAIKELEMVINLISFNVKKYLVTLNNSNNKNYYEPGQLCSNTDKTVGYIRRIILEIPDIVDKMYKSHDSKYILNNIKLKNLDKKFKFFERKTNKCLY